MRSKFLPSGMAIAAVLALWAGCDSNTTDPVTPGTATSVRVETAADGSGAVVPVQVLEPGTSITVFAITRDANNYFVANVAATAWTLEALTGGVVAGDLVPAVNGKSALLTGHATGGGRIRATSDALATTASGVITVAHVASVTNGQYLVEHVAGCGDCHTQRDGTGQPWPWMVLAGSVKFELPFGAVYSRNITPDSTTGIGSWTDAEIIAAIRTGVSPAHAYPNAADAQLFPIMPYSLYGHMSDSDAQDIVAFLRTVAPIHNVVHPDSIPPAVRTTWPLQAGIPSATPASSAKQHGQYLVTIAGCIDCHTVPKSEVTHIPTDAGFAMERFLAGGREFEIGPLATVHSKNLTPDPTTGIGTWRAAQIDSAISLGIDDEGRLLCPPMPWPVFQGMTPSDRSDIVAYLKGIPAIVNAVPEDSTVCPR